MTHSSVLRSLVFAALLIAATLMLILRIHSYYAPLPTTPVSLSPHTTPPHASLTVTPPPSPVPPRHSPTELRGRRGIIKYLHDTQFVVTPTDFDTPGEDTFTVTSDARTTFILVTIVGDRMPGQPSVHRTAYAKELFQIGDEIFVLSQMDITASSTFTALRIEKIETQ